MQGLKGVATAQDAGGASVGHELGRFAWGRWQ